MTQPSLPELRLDVAFCGLAIATDPAQPAEDREGAAELVAYLCRRAERATPVGDALGGKLGDAAHGPPGDGPREQPGDGTHVRLGALAQAVTDALERALDCPSVLKSLLCAARSVTSTPLAFASECLRLADAAREHFGRKSELELLLALVRVEEARLPREIRGRAVELALASAAASQ